MNLIDLKVYGKYSLVYVSIFFDFESNWIELNTNNSIQLNSIQCNSVKLSSIQSNPIQFNPTTQFNFLSNWNVSCIVDSLVYYCTVPYCAYLSSCSPFPAIVPWWPRWRQGAVTDGNKAVYVSAKARLVLVGSREPALEALKAGFASALRDLSLGAAPFMGLLSHADWRVLLCGEEHVSGPQVRLGNTW